MYRQRAGVHDLEDTSLPMGELYPGYLAIVFPQDAGTLSTLIVRRADDTRWPSCETSTCAA